MPYDFASFDHQPTKTEIQQFQEVIHDVAISAAGSDQRAEAAAIHSLIQAGHVAATLHAPAGFGNEDVFTMTGGLMYGLRTTLICRVRLE